MSRRGWVLFGSLSVIWGIPYLFIKIAVEQMSPATMVFWRVLLAAFVLLPVAVARGMLRPLLPCWRWVLLFAAVEIAVPFAMLGYAEQRISSSWSAWTPMVTWSRWGRWRWSRSGTRSARSSSRPDWPGCRASA